MAISYTISAAVGENNSPNKYADVLTVKTLLTIAAINQSQSGWRPGILNGFTDATLFRAIRGFQQAQAPFRATGVFEPRDQIFQRLVSIAKAAVKTLPANQPILIAASKRRPGKNVDGTVARDMLFGDYTKEQIKNIRWNFAVNDALLDDLTVSPATAKLHFVNFERMAKELFSAGEQQANIQRMIDKFRRSEGGNYSDVSLNRAVAVHEKTKAFQRELEGKLHTAIKKYQGDASRIRGTADVDLSSRLFFNTWGDIRGGLTIATNDIWAWDVELLEYKFDGLDYQAKYRITLYDHFGLDEPDVDSSKSYGNLAGFRSWFILQHLQGFAYKPFMTVVEVKQAFSGSLQ